MHSDDVRGAFDGSLLFKRAEAHTQRQAIREKQAADGTGSVSSERYDSATVAVALVTGVGLFLWALRSMNWI